MFDFLSVLKTRRSYVKLSRAESTCTDRPALYTLTPDRPPVAACTGKLSRLPQQAFDNVAKEAQILHERFTALQKKGMEVGGSSSKSLVRSHARSMDKICKQLH